MFNTVGLFYFILDTISEADSRVDWRQSLARASSYPSHALLHSTMFWGCMVCIRTVQFRRGPRLYHLLQPV